jgi:hypothetical protein
LSRRGRHVPAIAYFHCCVKDAEALHKAETIGQAVSSGCIRLAQVGKVALIMKRLPSLLSAVPL